MDALKSIVPFLSERLSNEGSVVHVSDHVRVPLKMDAFRGLSEGACPCVFVDGGNGEILRAPNASVQFVRLYAGKYDGLERVERVVRECFVVVTARKKELDLVFDAQLFSMEGPVGEPVVVDSLDPDLKPGSHRVTPTMVGSFMRMREEVRFAKELIKALKPGSLLVRDGDLLLTGPGMEQELHRLKLASEKLGVRVLGLSKTSSLCTDQGASAVAAIAARAPEGVWYYFADGQVGFTRLHADSRYVFRFDCFAHDREYLPRMLGALVLHAVDPVFLGYPYGLVDADVNARVSQEELAQLRMKFRVYSKELFDGCEVALDAHDVLNQL